LLADDNDDNDVREDHISCVFDGLSNTNALGIENATIGGGSYHLKYAR